MCSVGSFFSRVSRKFSFSSILRNTEWRPRSCLHQAPQSHFQAPWAGPTLAAQGQERGCLSGQVMRDRVGRETRGQALSMVISLGQRQVAGWESDPSPAPHSLTPRPQEHRMPYWSLRRRHTHTKTPRRVVARCQRPQAAVRGCHGHCLAPSPPAQTP